MDCPEILRSGARIGQPCGKPCRDGEERCGRHSTSSPAQFAHQKRQAFLAEFARTGIVSAAASHAGIGRRTHYDWLEHDPAYAAEFAEAVEEANDEVEAEVWRRGVEGWDEAHVDKKGDVFVTTRYSDSLLMFLAKKRNPAFRDGPRTLVTAGAGFDAQGNPWSGVQVGDEGEALAESFGAFRSAIDADSTEAQ